MAAKTVLAALAPAQPSCQTAAAKSNDTCVQPKEAEAEERAWQSVELQQPSPGFCDGSNRPSAASKFEGLDRPPTLS